MTDDLATMEVADGRTPALRATNVRECYVSVVSKKIFSGAVRNGCLEGGIA